MYLGCRRAQRLSTDEQTKSIVHVVSRIVAQLKLDEFTANQSLNSQQINYLNGSRFVRFVCAMRRTAKAHGQQSHCLVCPRPPVCVLSCIKSPERDVVNSMYQLCNVDARYTQVKMEYWLTNEATYLSTVIVTNISQRFTYKMAAKINWHRYEIKLRHCHPMWKIRVKLSVHMQLVE